MFTDCACGKSSYPSAAKAHEALKRHAKRIKRSKKSRSRFTREATQLVPGKVGAYQCTAGNWHHGHTSDH